MPSAAPDPVLLDELLGPLHGHFLAARTAYRAYLEEGRTFLHAGRLRRINLAARALLLGKGHLLPEEYRTCAAALVEHYQIWLTLWDEHAQRTRPAPGDRFAFENEATWPRAAEQGLERLYEQLRGTA